MDIKWYFFQIRTGLELPLTFSSYNCKGLGITKYEMLSSLLSKSDFCLVQEHWLYVHEFSSVIKNNFDDIECMVTSPMDESIQCRGRPKGGTAILYHRNINAKIERVHSDCNRLTIATVNIDDFKFCIFSVYMPYDEQRAGVHLDEFVDVLNEIHSVCLNLDCQYFIIGGDINCDLSRNVPQTHALNDFIEQENLFMCLKHESAKVPYTFHSGNSFSTLDHFIVTPNFKQSIIKYETCFLANDFSDHTPVLLQLNIDIGYHSMHKIQARPNVAWHKCSEEDIDHYRYEMNRLIDENTLDFGVFACSDWDCVHHKEQLCSWYNYLVNILLTASKESLPTTSFRENIKIIPGWNEIVKPKLEASLFWHNEWVNINRPRQGLVADNMRRARAQYHYAIRQVHRDNNDIRNKRMAEAISTNNQRNLWKEAKALSGCHNKLPNIIDDIKGDENIVPIFFDKYKSLYNVVNYSTDDMNDLKVEIDNLIKTHCSNNSSVRNVINKDHIEHLHMLHRNELINAVEKLKINKKEDSGLFTNHIKYASPKFHTLLTMFFNAVLSHGMAPDDLLLGTMFPLIKDSRGKIQSSDNYRAITIGTCISKLFELIILNKQAYAFHTGELQFGFKGKSSTVTCSFVVQEVINYYNSNNSNVYTVLLDASKAFDRVNFIKLFRKLIEKNMCPLIIRLLLNSYINQKLNVRWNVALSEMFSVSNGVRQGGILSPIFFAIYIDELLFRLKRSGVGCHMGNHFVGSLGFADDITLLCPTLHGLKIMINICEQFAKEYDLLFNGKKSMLMVFSKDKSNVSDPCIKLNGDIIKKVNSAIHLGNFLSTENENECIEEGIKKFNCSVNMFLSRFKVCNPTTRVKLFQQYCMSLYGSQLWPLCNKKIVGLNTKWNIALRRVLCLPNRTHNDLLPLIALHMPIEVSLHCRFLKFFKTNQSSENPIVKYITEYSITSVNSTMGRNVRLITSRLNIPVCDVLGTNNVQLRALCYNKWFDMVSEDYKIHSSLIRDLIYRKEDINIELFDRVSCDFIINFLCLL